MAVLVSAARLRPVETGGRIMVLVVLLLLSCDECVVRVGGVWEV